ncbi:MAG TPA: hypothetical protein VGR08_01220 [Thermomicrobiales bacterium]|nr:hypothetical protein [Thermomicrobiales bacterium]
MNVFLLLPASGAVRVARACFSGERGWTAGYRTARWRERFREWRSGMRGAPAGIDPTDGEPTPGEHPS